MSAYLIKSLLHSVAVRMFGGGAPPDCIAILALVIGLIGGRLYPRGSSAPVPHDEGKINCSIENTTLKGLWVIGYPGERWWADDAMAAMKCMECGIRSPGVGFGSPTGTTPGVASGCVSTTTCASAVGSTLPFAGRTLLAEPHPLSGSKAWAFRPPSPALTEIADSDFQHMEPTSDVAAAHDAQTDSQVARVVFALPAACGMVEGVRRQLRGIRLPPRVTEAPLEDGRLEAMPIGSSLPREATAVETDTSGSSLDAPPGCVWAIADVGGSGT